MTYDPHQGVCYGLKEVLDGVSRHQLTDHLAELLPAVQAALTDDSAAVRQVRSLLHVVSLMCTSI